MSKRAAFGAGFRRAAGRAIPPVGDGGEWRAPRPARAPNRGHGTGREWRGVWRKGG